MVNDINTILFYSTSAQINGNINYSLYFKQHLELESHCLWLFNSSRREKNGVYVHMVFVFLFMIYLTWYDNLWVHLCCYKWHCFILFCAWVVSHSTYVPRLLYPFISLVCSLPCFCWRLHIPGGSLVIPGFPFIVEGEALTSWSEPLNKCICSTAVFSLFLTVESLSGLAGFFCWGTPKCRITLWSCPLSLKRSPSVFWWIGVGWRMVEICGWPPASGSRTGAWARGLPIQQAETHGIPISGSRACSTLLHASLPSFSQGVHSFDLENGRWLLRGVSGESGDLPYCAAAFRSVPCPLLMSHPHHPRPWGSASMSSWGFMGASQFAPHCLSSLSEGTLLSQVKFLHPLSISWILLTFFGYITISLLILLVLMSFCLFHFFYKGNEINTCVQADYLLRIPKH